MSGADPTARGADAISQAFARRKEAGGKALVPYIMAGDPDLGSTEKIVRALSGIGADVIELGMPFSDPLADGPVIQRAAQRAIRQGVTLKKLIAMVEELRLDVITPIAVMTYYNLFLHYGLERFAEDAARAGVDGVIVPDLPPEEAVEFRDALDAKGLAMIHLAAPTSTDGRLRKIAESTRGFLYYVSRTGVTGAQADISGDLAENLRRIRAATDKPVAVGFGVSTPEQAREIATHADGVVMGSVIVDRIEKTADLHDREVARFLRPIVEALHNPKTTLAGT